jgi:diguanylate cyclase (GGDEF)-like protein
MGAIFTRDKLQKLFTKLDKGVSPYVVKQKIRDIFLSELESRIIDNAILLDEKGAPLVSEGEIRRKIEYDKTFLGKIYEAKTKSKWLYPVIDKRNKTIDFFVIPENPYGYFVQLTFSLGSLKEALSDVYRPVLFTVVIVIIANIILATLLSRTLVSPVKVLNQATKDIAGGNLDRKVSIKTQDELEELSDTFNYMTDELKRMRAKAENANPLTKLPGNIVIREEVERRTKNNEKFVLIYCDLDNFKAFNDKYGVHSGDEVIMLTAKILGEAIAKKGTDKDFIGHEGGDDFLLLTSPTEAETITDYIIKEFDNRITRSYPKEDANRGYIEAPSRDSDAVVKFPIMTISMVGISNIRREITSYSQITNIAAELKKAAKQYKKSNFLMDRREEDKGIEYRRKLDKERKEAAERRGPTKERRGPTKERRNPNG